MNRIAILLVSLFTSLIVSAQTPTPTPTPYALLLPVGFNWYYLELTGSYYAVNNTLLSWHDANSFAEELKTKNTNLKSSHLASVTSQEEDSWLVSNFSSSFTTSEILWIGLPSSNEKYWTSGETVEYFHLEQITTFGRSVAYYGGTGQWGLWESNRPSNSIIEISLLEPIPTPTPTTTPTPTPTPQGVFFQGVDLNQNNMVSSPPAGFLNGRVSFGNVIDTGSSDGTGMKIDLNPGQGMLMFSLIPIESPGLMQITSRIKTSNAEPAVALIALNSSLDGQFSFVNLTSNALPVGNFNEVKLYYDPPDGQMLLGIQAVNSPFSTISTTVMVDEIIAKLNQPSNLTLLNTEVDGTFEGGLERGLGKLYENINNVTGRVIPIFETLTNISIQLSIQPTDVAANVGTILPDSVSYLPGEFISSVKVKRDGSTTEGTFAMVVTNGIQNYTLFRNIAELPTINSGEYETIIGGASFFENNPSVPVTLVVQNGGNNTNSTIVIDDLFLSKR